MYCLVINKRRKEKMSMKAILLVLLMSTLCLLQSCTGIQSSYRMYKGDPLPEDEVALLVTKIASPFGATRVNIHSVDGHDVKGSLWDGTIRVELLPGSHTIKADFISLRDLPYYYMEDCVEIKLNVMPGVIYEVNAKDAGTGAYLVLRKHNRIKDQSTPLLYTQVSR